MCYGCKKITDGLVDLLIQLVHKIDVRAEKRVEAEYLNEFKRVSNKEGILYQIAEAALDHPDDPVREVVFPVASEKLLRDVIKEYKAKSPAFHYPHVLQPPLSPNGSPTTRYPDVSVQ